MRKKICFGGTFNPIHNGHLHCARAAAEAGGFGNVVLFPAGSPPHKPGQAGLASAKDRLKMCKLAIKGVRGFEIDDRETQRLGPSFTIDTARQLKRNGWDEVIWLIGADMVHALPTWHEADALLSEVRFLIMARPGTQLSWSTLPPAFQKLQENVVEVPQIDISSTDIRKRAEAGLPIDFLAPAEVCRYIAEHGLYRGNSGAAGRGYMINHYDIAYGLGVGLSSPYWLAKSSRRRKVIGAFSQRMGRVPERDLSKPGIMIHAVSLGEINATRSLVNLLRTTRPGLGFIVSVTTDTGYARGQELYGSAPDVTLVRYPLDFTPAVDRLLDTLRPAVVALLELEVWPNFIRRCARRNIPVILVNGRITPGSFKKYRLAQPLVGSMFAKLHHVAAQDQEYAWRFIKLGAPTDRVSVTGTMKFDTAEITDRVGGEEELAAAVGLLPGQRVWVCGSTGPGEEAILLPMYRETLKQFPELRLVIVPRKPERFDEVAELIIAGGFSVVRRSTSPAPPSLDWARPIILGDTIGELRKFYALADVVFVGRTLADLGHRQHGSDMIEPAALGKAVVVGPFTANFAEAMNCFRQANAMVVVQSAQELERAIEALLKESDRAKAMGQSAREVVRNHQGATQRHAGIILDTLDSVLTMKRG